MGRLAGFTCRQVTLRLRRLGFEFDRQARGSHEIWWNPTTRHRTTVPNHPGDLPEGTLSAVLKQCGCNHGRIPWNLGCARTRSLSAPPLEPRRPDHPWRCARNRSILRKDIANRIDTAIPFRNTQALANTAMVNALQNRSFVQPPLSSGTGDGQQVRYKPVTAVRSSPGIRIVPGRNRMYAI